MARWRDDDDPWPERLARFVADEWGDEDPAGKWGEAARAWLTERPGRTLPLAADPVEILQWVVALRARLAEQGHPHPGPRMPANPWARTDEEGQ